MKNLLIDYFQGKFFTELINRLYAEALKYKVITSRKLKSRFEVPVGKIITSGGEDEVFMAYLLNSNPFNLSIYMPGKC